MTVKTLTAAAVVCMLLSDSGCQSATAQSGTSRYDLPPASGGTLESGSTASTASRDPYNPAGQIQALEADAIERVPLGRPPASELPQLDRGEGSPPRASTMAQPAAGRAPARTYGSSSRSSAAETPSNSKVDVDSQYAEQMMQAALEPQSGTRLAGSRVSLAQVVRTAGTRREQSMIINAYWDLCSATADYYLSLYEQAELERLASRSPQLTTPLRAAIQMMATRRDTSLTAARATQLKLASLMGSSGQSLPLPGDMPLCSAYHTRYTQNFPNGGPQEAAELHKLLPLRHAELLDAAASVSEAEDFFDQVVRQAGGSGDAQGVVKALQLLALNRRAFVQIARDYNRRITRYTELAKPGDLRTERLVAMLIKTPNLASRGSAESSPPPGRRSNTTPPATFRSPLTNSGAPMLDSEVLPVGGFVEEVGSLQNSMVQKVSPDEKSVLVEPAGE